MNIEDTDKLKEAVRVRLEDGAVMISFSKEIYCFGLLEIANNEKLQGFIVASGRWEFEGAAMEQYLADIELHDVIEYDSDSQESRTHASEAAQAKFLQLFQSEFKNLD